MSKLKVFQNVKNRRAVSGFLLGKPGTVLFMLLILPYLLTVFMGNINREKETLQVAKLLLESEHSVRNQTPKGVEEIPIELYVADKLARTMPQEYEEEALKAQAVLIRTNLLMQETEGIELYDTGYGQNEIADEYMQAVIGTKGVYLLRDGKPIYAPHFWVSNGMTREGKNSNATVCDRDFLSPEFTTSVLWSKKEFDELWKEIEKTEQRKVYEDIKDLALKQEEKSDFIMVRDTSGYVAYLSYQGQWANGEKFRYQYYLPSADFTIEKENDEYSLRVTGCGHGFGMSRFAANEMAKEGSSYPEILEYFFENITITKAE